MASRSLRQRRTAASSPSPPANSISTNRPRRAAAQASTAATANALDRETETPDEPRGPTRLKIAPSKLRQTETASSITVGGRGKGARESFEGGEILAGSRPRKKAIVEESSDEEEDELAQEQDEDEDEDEEEDDGEDDEEDEEDVEAEDDEDAEADEDVDMDDLPPARPTPAAMIRAGGAGGMKTKPSVTITPAKEDPIASVEDKEMAMGTDDDLSDLDSLGDGNGADEDAEGELEDEEMLEDDEDEDDAEGDSDDATPGSMSRSHTPDPSKLTRRQRGEIEGSLLALSNEAQKKKHLTAEEHQARRAEMARRRKNLSEKRNEEEKMDTINRLLKKQAPKRRTRKEIEAEEAAEAEEYDQLNPSSIYVRWTNNAQGSTVSVPQEYLQAENVNGVFLAGITGGRPTPFNGRMVEEIPVG